MKIVILNLTLIFLTNIQCGVVKNLVETAASEVHKVAGYIENVTSNKRENESDQQSNTDQTIEINTNTTSHEGDTTKQTVSTKVTISELQNADAIRQNPDLDNNTPVQINVDITLVVNYNNVSKVNTDRVSSTDKNKDEIFTTDNPISATYVTTTDPNTITNNTAEQSPIKTSAIVGQKVNANIKFPGPTNAPIVTYNEGVVVVETNENITNIDKFLFPDSKDSKVNVTAGCPDGMFLTETGYCLMSNEGKERQKNEDFDGKRRMAFTGGCFQGYARALDGSCQQIIED